MVGTKNVYHNEMQNKIQGPIFRLLKALVGCTYVVHSYIVFLLTTNDLSLLQPGAAALLRSNLSRGRQSLSLINVKNGNINYRLFFCMSSRTVYVIKPITAT